MKLSASRTTELFEILTLVQTHKMRKRIPIVLFGSEYALDSPQITGIYLTSLDRCTMGMRCNGYPTRSLRRAHMLRRSR
jgi:hypothetical protein